MAVPDSSTPPIDASSASRKTALLQWLQNLLDRILMRTWYVHSGTYLRVKITGSQAYRLLELAARPSIQRLHLRNLFVRGRRYFLKPDDEGSFRMTTTHKVLWHPRRRSSASAVLLVNVSPIDDQHSWLIMRGRFRIAYLLDIFLWPTFMTSMLIYMRWSPLVIAVLVVMLYGLSWMTHRYSAELETHEMIFFVEKALEDYIPAPPANLAPRGADIVVERDFPAAWDRFVESIEDDVEVPRQ